MYTIDYLHSRTIDGVIEDCPRPRGQLDDKNFASERSGLGLSLNTLAS